MKHKLPVKYAKKVESMSYFWQIPLSKVIFCLCTFLVVIIASAVVYFLNIYIFFNDNTFFDFRSLEVLYYFLLAFTVLIIYCLIIYFHHMKKNKSFTAPISIGWVVVVAYFALFIIFACQLFIFLFQFYKGFIGHVSFVCDNTTISDKTKECVELISLRNTAIAWIAHSIIMMFFILICIWNTVKNLTMMGDFQRNVKMTYTTKYVNLSLSQELQTIAQETKLAQEKRKPKLKRKK